MGAVRDNTLSPGKSLNTSENSYITSRLTVGQTKPLSLFLPGFPAVLSAVVSRRMSNLCFIAGILRVIEASPRSVEIPGVEFLIRQQFAQIDKALDQHVNDLAFALHAAVGL
jgi:hypothetical protein